MVALRCLGSPILLICKLLVSEGELNDLNDEANMPIEELMKKYAAAGMTNLSWGFTVRPWASFRPVYDSR